MKFASCIHSLLKSSTVIKLQNQLKTSYCAYFVVMGRRKCDSGDSVRAVRVGGGGGGMGRRALIKQKAWLVQRANEVL